MLIHQGLESTFSIGRGGTMYWEGEAWDLSAFSDYCKSYYGTNIMPVNIMSVKYCDSHVKVTNRNVTCIKDRKLKRVYSNHRPVQLLYETWDTLTKALSTFTVSLSFLDRQTGKSKDQALKQQHYLGRKNKLGFYHRPIYFSRIDPNKSSWLINVVSFFINPPFWEWYHYFN